MLNFSFELQCFLLRHVLWTKRTKSAGIRSCTVGTLTALELFEVFVISEMKASFEICSEIWYKFSLLEHLTVVLRVIGTFMVIYQLTLLLKITPLRKSH